MSETGSQPLGGVYRRLAVMTATHGINDGAVLAIIPLIPLLALEFGLNTVEVGLLTGVSSLAGALLQMPASFVADYTGRRRTLLAAGLFLIAISYVLYSVASSFAMLLVLGVLLGVAGCVYHPSALAIVDEQFSQARKAFFLAVHSAGANMGMALIPIAVGWLAHQWGWRPALELMAIPAALVGVLTLLSFREQRTVKSSVRGSLRDVWSQVLCNPRLLILAGVNGSHSAAYFGIVPFIPLFLQQTYGWGTDAIGLGLFIMSGAGCVTQPFVGRLADRVGRLKTMAASLLCVAVLMSLIPTLQFAWVVYPLFACIGVVLFSIWPLMGASVTDFADKDTVSSAVGLNFTVGMLGGALAPVLSGALIRATNLTTGLYWAPVFFLVTLGFVLALVKMAAARPRPALHSVSPSSHS